MRKAHLTATLLLACMASPAHAVVYGDDDRVDYYQATSAQRGAADAVFLIVDIGMIDYSDPFDIKIPGPTWGEYHDLCDDERFYGQPTAGWCSATLIDDDLFLTAGHCISSSECSSTALVFNYHMVNSTDLETITVDDVFTCDEVVAHENTPGGDYAIVRLDRPATPRFQPALVDRIGLIEYSPTGGELVVIGHPTGLPTKIADNGWVKVSHEDYFEANVDSFGGNSGSAVFNNSTDEVVGILVRGESDYVYDHGRSCWMTNDCDDDLGCDPPLGTGFQHVLRNTLFAQWIPPRCGDHLCDPGEDNIICPEDCPSDIDYDDVPDFLDNCPSLPNLPQGDFDSDGLGDACDCDSADPTIWSTPSEVPSLTLSHDRLTGWTLLEWTPLPAPGALDVVFDTLRSSLPFDFMAADCIESDDGGDLMAEDFDPILPGAAYYYLVRAQNACPQSEGALGVDWRFRPREGRPCP